MKSKGFRGKLQLDAWWPNFPNIEIGITFPDVIFHIVMFPDVIFHIVIFPDVILHINSNILIAIFPFAIPSISFPFDR